MAVSPSFQYTIPYKRLAFIALITIPLFGITGVIPIPLLPSHGFTWVDAKFIFISVILNVLLVWCLNILLLYLFIKYFNNRYHWIRYIASFVLCGLAAVLITYILKELRIDHPGGGNRMFVHFERRPPTASPVIMTSPRVKMTQPFFILRILPFQSVNIIILILLEVILLRSRKNSIEKENDLLRITNLEAKQHLLKQQLQPHFLFNSLTIVKALIKKDPEKADKYVDMLSELLRYAVYSNNNYMVTVEEELKYVKTYLEMQKIRFKDSLEFSLNIPPELMEGKIPVYSIQLLVENAQKHNILTDSMPLYIRAYGDVASESIIIENNLQKKASTQATEGLGLKNLSERYQLLGGEPPVITQTADQFIVSLKVWCHEHSDH